ncbi:MAG: RNA polymerase sigma factor [Candidatus Micrarchaeaceae archaeon]
MAEHMTADDTVRLTLQQTAVIEDAYASLGEAAYLVARSVFLRYGIHPSQCHLNAEDAEQDVFLAMMEQMAAEGRDELTPPTTSTPNVPSYIKRGAQNKAIDAMRKRANRDQSLNKIEEDITRPDHANPAIATIETDYAEDAGRKEFILRTLRVMVQAKKQQFADIIRLVDVEGYSLSAAAEILGISLSASKTSHARAVILFRKIYTDITSSQIQTPVS